MWRVALAITAALFLSQPSTGSISGTAVEPAGGVLPGVKVTATWAGGERTAVTDSWGRFSLNDLPIGRYSVTAELAGFETVTREAVIIRSGRTASINLLLRVGCIAEVAYVDHGFARTRATADAIATIRISNDPPRACRKTLRCVCTQHGAEVVRRLRDPKGLLTRRIQLVQDGAGALSSERPYTAGQEFVAFLRYDAGNKAFTRMTGPVYMFPVRDGRVEFRRTDAPGLSDGMPVEAFYEILTRF
jgi:hypothetical protein